MKSLLPLYVTNAEMTNSNDEKSRPLDQYLTKYSTGSKYDFIISHFVYYTLREAYESVKLFKLPFIMEGVDIRGRKSKIKERD